MYHHPEQLRHGLSQGVHQRRGGSRQGWGSRQQKLLQLQRRQSYVIRREMDAVGDNDSKPGSGR